MTPLGAVAGDAGHDAVHTSDWGLAEAEDSAICQGDEALRRGSRLFHQLALAIAVDLANSFGRTNRRTGRTLIQQFEDCHLQRAVGVVI